MVIYINIYFANFTSFRISKIDLIDECRHVSEWKIVFSVYLQWRTEMNSTTCLGL